MIREAGVDELPKLLELYRHLHEDDECCPDESALEKVWEDICKNPCIHYYVKELDGVWISTCHLVIIPNLTRGARPYGIIENVVTHRDNRGKGHGQAVLRHALKQAWKADCYKVMLMTGRKEEAVFRFYESVGFDRNSKQAFIAKPH